MIICVCRQISDREIARQARAGMGFDGIQLELGVITLCGCCEGCARDVVAQCNASYPITYISSDTHPAQAASWNTPAF